MFNYLVNKCIYVRPFHGRCTIWSRHDISIYTKRYTSVHVYSCQDPTLTISIYTKRYTSVHVHSCQDPTLTIATVALRSLYICNIDNIYYRETKTSRTQACNMYNITHKALQGCDGLHWYYICNKFRKIGKLAQELKWRRQERHGNLIHLIFFIIK